MQGNLEAAGCFSNTDTYFRLKDAEKTIYVLVFK
jgi:hypothetical protein